MGLAFQLTVRFGVLGFLLLSSPGFASELDQEWGEMGYANPSAKSAELPPMPLENGQALRMSDAPSPKESRPVEELEVTTTASSAEITTRENTFGVLTEERAPVQVYVAPMGGVASVLGNTAADVNPQYAAGGSIGVLLSNHIVLEASFLHDEQEFSNPRVNATSGLILNNVGAAFILKQNLYMAGGKLFILGRESRLRPFIGAGAGYSEGNLNYTQNYMQYLGGQPQYTSNFSLNQWDAFGELGAEFAFTKKVAATLSFKLAGALSSKTTNDSQANLGIDPSKSDVGNSLSRSTTYVLGAGVGIYF